MFESAFLHSPVISAGGDVYLIKQENRSAELITSIENKIIYTPVSIYNKQNPDQTDTDCLYKTTLETLCKESNLHFTPFTIRDPKDNYKEAHFISRLFHILGQFKNSTSTKSTNSFELEFDQFILVNSASNKFLLTKVDVGLPPDRSIPFKIHLIGSNYPIEEIDPAVYSFDATTSPRNTSLPSHSPVHSSENAHPSNLEYSLIASFSLLPGDNSFTIYHSSPCSFSFPFLPYSHFSSFFPSLYSLPSSLLISPSLPLFSPPLYSFLLPPSLYSLSPLYSFFPPSLPPSSPAPFLLFHSSFFAVNPSSHLLPFCILGILTQE